MQNIFSPQMGKLIYRSHHSPVEKLSVVRFGWFLSAWCRLGWNEMYFWQKSRNLPSRSRVHSLLVDIDQKLEINFCLSRRKLY